MVSQNISRILLCRGCGNRIFILEDLLHVKVIITKSIKGFWKTPPTNWLGPTWWVAVVEVPNKRGFTWIAFIRQGLCLKWHTLNKLKLPVDGEIIKLKLTNITTQHEIMSSKLKQREPKQFRRNYHVHTTKHGWILNHIFLKGFPSIFNRTTQASPDKMATSNT